MSNSRTARWAEHGALTSRLRRLVRAPWFNRNTGVVERLVALMLLVIVALVAGLTLGHNTERLAELPGLLLMVPAAIALRGNIFGAMGSRLGTAIHAGTFRLSARPSSVVGENLLASLILTSVTSVALAVLAKGAAVVFGIANSISIIDFVMISAAGGLLASIAVLVTALALTAGSVRFGWDPDNVTAPLVTAMGDVATVPALVLASMLVGRTGASETVAAIALASAPAGLWLAVRHGREGLHVILRESMPVLILGIVLDLIAGITVERQLASFTRFPALLVLLPAFLAVAGAMGGTLSSRLSTQLHLGTVTPQRFPQGRARSDLALSFALVLPVFITSGVLAHLLARWSGLASPGLWWMALLAVLGGIVVNLLAAAVAYYGTITSVQVGLDPDTWGIPLVTSTLDLLGAFTLILAVELLGFT